jgi:hypothetical protein
VVQGAKKIVELGCGPARLLKPVENRLKDYEQIEHTGIDHDSAFIEYELSVIDWTRTGLIQIDAQFFSPDAPVDVFYSQGFHHHVKKGKPMEDYLSNVYKQLAPQGAYVVGDEFLAEYINDEDRCIKAIIWYSHIIANAKKRKIDYLATEEAKTLLDDLLAEEDRIKTPEQINLVLENATAINDYAGSKNFLEANRLANILLGKLKSLSGSEKTGDPTMDFSRGDFKISRSAFVDEVEKAGFRVEKFKSFGPVKDIGALGVYKLRKAI